MNKAFEKILEMLEEDCVSPSGYPGYMIDLEVACNIVKEVAEEYKDGWIPCSKMMPEENIEVLVSVREIDGGIYTRTSWVQDGIWVIKKTPLQPTVIAWQPLPESYKERE